MDKDAISLRFRSMAQLSSDEAEPFLWLVDAALAQVEALLLPGVSQAPPLVDLAAAFAFYRFALLQEDGGETVRALDLSLSRKDGRLLRRAELLRKDALVQAAPFLRDSGFSFAQAGSCPGRVAASMKGGQSL